MNSEEALQISANMKSAVDNNEYDLVKTMISYAAKQGRTDVFIGFSMVSFDNEVRLRNEGYLFYTIGDNHFIPKMYRITWRKESKKKKWYHKLF